MSIPIDDDFRATPMHHVPANELLLPGVYGVFHTQKRTVYIGSSACMARRIGNHLRQLRSGTHNNKQFQLDWSEDGEDRFVWGVFDFLPGQPTEVLRKREIQRIQQYMACKGSASLYNVRLASGKAECVRLSFNMDRPEHRALYEFIESEMRRLNEKTWSGYFQRLTRAAMLSKQGDPSLARLFFLGNRGHTVPMLAVPAPPMRSTHSSRLNADNADVVLEAARHAFD